jgi:hypothetical protein
LVFLSGLSIVPLADGVTFTLPWEKEGSGHGPHTLESPNNGLANFELPLSSEKLCGQEMSVRQKATEAWSPTCLDRADTATKVALILPSWMGHSQQYFKIIFFKLTKKKMRHLKKLEN